MMRNTTRAAVLAGAAFVFTVAIAQAPAAVAQDAARLGADLTPLGGEKAGNSAGTIPAWDGGITKPPANYKVGDHHPDPFAADAPRATITAANMGEFAAQLTPGHQALLKAYPSFKMAVYPTRRSASFPDYVYDAVKANVGRARLVEGGNGVTGAAIGVPFPMPKNGQEAIWNHLMRFRGEAIKREVNQAAPTRGGDYTLVKIAEDILLPYSVKGTAPDSTDNKLAYFLQRVIAPARLAGEILLVHETLNQIAEPRDAWTYNSGQRRVRRAPNIAYDTPGTASDGMRTTDQFDMFSGAIDRYDWELVGKKEMIVPYNSYKLHAKGIPYEQILQPGHLNPDLLRYELHRVWVVEAKLKGDQRHIYARRTIYLDEDSWQILAVDQYDGRDQLWRVSEGHVINYYEVPTVFTTLEVHYDLQAGRYLAFGLDNNEAMYDFSVKYSTGDFTPDALRRAGTR